MNPKIIQETAARSILQKLTTFEKKVPASDYLSGLYFNPLFIILFMKSILELIT